MVKKVAPDVHNAAQTVCNLDEIMLSEIKTNQIDEPMLGWSTGQANEILEKWSNIGKVETCEVVLLNELLSDSDTENNWRIKIGLQNAMKNQACTVIECFDKYSHRDYTTIIGNNLGSVFLVFFQIFDHTMEQRQNYSY